MAQVPEKVLSWLYSVLHEYHDAQRTYSDTARVLSIFPTLSPRTEVYTYENGTSSLLLILSGTIPVTFRGTIYRFPLKLWIPRAYPREAPTGYITPGRDMMIRAGQHVGVDGRIYHPYLRDWGKMWDRASIAEFLEFLQQVFAKEPPVISATQQQPPRPPPKQAMEGSGAVETSNADVPPPRPPKPGDQPTEEWPQRTSSRNLATDGPPLPPIPPELSQRQQYTQPQPFQGTYATELPSRPKPQPPPPSQATLSQPPRYENGRAAGPPLPPIPDQTRPPQQPYQQQRSNYERSPVSPVSPMNGYSELPERQYSHPPPSMQNSRLQKPPNQQQPPIPRTHYSQQQAQYPPGSQPAAPPQAYPHSQTYPPPQQQPKPQPSQPPPDLLSDPFEVALPSPSASGPPLPAPPIPPNPEKEHLLHALSTTLTHQAQQTVQQNLSALQPLQAQQTALRTAHSRLEAEIRQLEQLNTTIAANEAILHRSIQECDRTISSAKSKPPPAIDEVLIPTTMVANQLWTLCAEEAACREAMYVLQKAVDRERVSGGDFVRQMRGLGRECFLKMVLARKCARGLGLEVDGR